jgi:hypothetical protein
MGKGIKVISTPASLSIGDRVLIPSGRKPFYKYRNNDNNVVTIKAEIIGIIHKGESAYKIAKEIEPNFHSYTIVDKSTRGNRYLIKRYDGKISTVMVCNAFKGGK